MFDKVCVDFLSDHAAEAFAMRDDKQMIRTVLMRMNQKIRL
ncbi:MAG: hypothetical protein WEB53_10930 [Akkermansiaceae bacterium]